MPRIPTAPSTRIQIDGPADSPQVSLETADGRRVTLHSRRNPRAEAAAWLAGALQDGSNPRLVVVIGAGAGYVLDELETRLPDAPVVVLEPDPVLGEVARRRRNFEASIASGRLRWLTGPDYVGASELWRTFDRHPGDVLTLEHPVFTREYPDQLARARAIVERAAFDASANAEARRLFAGPYLLNTLENLPTIVGSGDVGALRGLLHGHAALLVAAGPSLDETVADVRRLRDRVVVIAVDTALRPLLAAGVQPDLVVAVDPAEANARHLRDLSGDVDSWLVAEGSLHPSAFPAFAGRTFTFKVSEHAPWPWLQRHGLDRAKLRAWGSVLTSAFDLGLMLGCEPLIFVGADLAFTGRRPYCRGTTYEEDWAAAVARGTSLSDVWAASLRARALLDVEDLNGRPTPTAPHLVAFRDWLVEQASVCGRRIINASGHGILAGRGLAQMPLDRALADRAPVDTETVSERLVRAHRESVPGRHECLTALRSIGSQDRDLEAAIDSWSHSLSAEQTTDLRQTLAQRLVDLDDALVDSPVPSAGRRWHEGRAPDPRLWAPECAMVLEAIRSGRPCPDIFRHPPDLEAAGRALVAAIEALMANGSTSSGHEALEWLAEAVRLSPARSVPPLVGLPSADAHVLNLSELLTTPPALQVDTMPGGAMLDGLCSWAAAAAYWQVRAVGAPALPFVRLVNAVVRGASAQAVQATGARRRSRLVRGTLRLGENRHLVLDNLPVDASLLAEGLLGAMTERVGEDVPAKRLALAAPSIMAPVSGQLQLEPATPPQRDTFDWTWPFTSRARWVEPRNLTDAGFGRGYYAAQLPGGRALVIKTGTGQSAAVDGDGGETPRDVFPAAISGELPWGSDGGAIAWNTEHMFVRRKAGAHAEPYRMPALAHAAYVEGHGRVLWPTLNAGLWEWAPSRGFRFLAAVPPVNGIRKSPAGYELDPIVMTSGPAFPRVQLDYTWQWTPGRDVVLRVAGRPEGQSWSLPAVYDNDIEATAYNFTDLVRLRTRGGRTFDLYVPQPLMLAWAGRSLLITTSSATVLLFEDLITQLDGL